MLMRGWAMALCGASAACGFAAFGLALYAQSPAAPAAAGLFAGFGFAAGLLCGGLHWVFDAKPSPRPPALSSEALAGLVRATLASACAERQPGHGSAANRRSTPAKVAGTALAGAAASALAALPAGAVSTGMVLIGAVSVAGALAPAAPATASAAAETRRFASSEFDG